MKKAVLTLIVLAFVLSPLHNFGMNLNEASAACITSASPVCCSVGTRCTSSCGFAARTSKTGCFNNSCTATCSSASCKTSLQSRILNYFRISSRCVIK